jgi:hypothetical protein
MKEIFKRIDFNCRPAEFLAPLNCIQEDTISGRRCPALVVLRLLARGTKYGRTEPLELLKMYEENEGLTSEVSRIGSLVQRTIIYVDQPSSRSTSLQQKQDERMRILFAADRAKKYAR